MFTAADARKRFEDTNAAGQFLEAHKIAIILRIEKASYNDVETSYYIYGDVGKHQRIAVIDWLESLDYKADWDDISVDTEVSWRLNISW